MFCVARGGQQVIDKVVPGSAAAQAGLRADDVVTAIGEDSIASLVGRVTSTMAAHAGLQMTVTTKPRQGAPAPKKAGKKPQRGKQASVYLGFNSGESSSDANTAALESAGDDGYLEVTDALTSSPQDGEHLYSPMPFAERHVVGAMDRGDAENLLRAAGSRVGDFLVRESRGVQVLTVVLDSGKAAHHTISEDAASGQCTVNKKHTVAAGSVEDLIKQWLADPASAKTVLRCSIVEHPVANPN